MEDTQNDAPQFLTTGRSLAERFWELWKDSYLTSLREQHTRNLNQGRSSPKKPRVGQVVLLQDPFLPRNTWKLGRITRHGSTAKEEIRQVELKMGNGRTTRRPVNTLIPLELEEAEEEKEDGDFIDYPRQEGEERVVMGQRAVEERREPAVEQMRPKRKEKLSLLCRRI
ncbi:unnamed protein product [Strongylus vulgaris]|uniref:DUF5641 domain-containing protein n=1 Tax=Strongylus vulgaris TaxID=40348 RepID=A0A3P7KTW0_STRVU|nr:unnamed protein product [Strongylus vulgaris]